MFLKKTELLSNCAAPPLLAFKDEHGVWLGTGSHPEDVDVLGMVPHLWVEPVTDHRYRLARIQFQSAHGLGVHAAAGIIAIPENRGWVAVCDYPTKYWGHAWTSYRKMVWGSKIATCPTRHLPQQQLGYMAVDLGVALLVKAWALARAATHEYSCDGHGKEAYASGEHILTA